MPPQGRFAALGQAAVLLATAGVFFTAPARGEDCPASYANYEADWAITRAQWDADCAAGRKPDEILRARQQSFMTDCADYFRPFLTKAKVEEWNLQVYCAQGAPGESRLSAMTNAPPRRAPPPPSAPPQPALVPSANPAAHFYNLIDTTCSRLPGRITNDLPKGISPRARYYGTVNYHMYVSNDSRPPLCHFEVDAVVAHAECDPERHIYVKTLSDAGCTGKLATMTLADSDGRPVGCSQRQIDSMFSALEKEYLETHPSLPR